MSIWEHLFLTGEFEYEPHDRETALKGDRD